MAMKLKIEIKPGVWMVLAIILAGLSGALYVDGHPWIAIACFVAALQLAKLVFGQVSRLRSRIRYIISAAMNGDFSYKFPVEGVNEHERDINQALNRLVVHLEQLSHDAQQNERFLGVVINLVETGIVVADSRGDVVQHNRAALRLLSLPVLTNVCQFVEAADGYDSSSLSISRTDAKLHGQQLAIYTINDIRRPIQTAEVESWEKLTRVLTHEIMNSLTPINSIAETLKGESSEDDSLMPQLEVITASSRSLMDFVRNFRKFTILPEPRPQVIYVKPFLERAVVLAANFEGASGVMMTVAVHPADAMAYADESMLSQVVVNILKNAVEASPTQIDVTAKVREDESVEICISNDGEPIEEELASQIFTPFFTTKPDGSGIGLSLSRRIVSRLGGTLSLSTSPRTAFTILLY